MHLTDVAVRTAINNLTETTTGLFNPYHEARDPQKVTELAASIRENGWQGPPLVADGENAATGSHRLAAVALLANQEGIETRVPYVDLAQLCDVYGIDWTGHRSAALDWSDAVITVAGRLPYEVREYLGLDAH